MILFENQIGALERQLQDIKKAIQFFTEERAKVALEDIVLTKVEPHAVLLRSQIIMEKGFPLIYFIQHCKWLGFNELASCKKIEDFLEPSDNPEVKSSLKSFFRGCLYYESDNPLETLDNLVAQPNEGTTHPFRSEELDVSYSSALIEKSIRAAKWGLHYSLDYLSYLAGTEAVSSPGPVSGHMSTQVLQKELSDDQNSKRKFIDIPVVRVNWYGRSQKRLYRFHSDYFERIDPEGVSGTEVKASFLYADVDKLTIENSNDLVIYFRNPKMETQWITSPQANKIIGIICTRIPWTSTVTVTRNLEMKMKKINCYSVVVKLSSDLLQSPRWSKDGLSLAYKDEHGWRSIDLETIAQLTSRSSPLPLLDPIHSPDLFAKKEKVAIVGYVNGSKISQNLSEEVLNKEYLEVSAQTVNYAADSAIGNRTQQSGFISELVHSTQDENSYLFVSKANEMISKHWKLKNLELQIQGKKCINPAISPDAKFIAFTEDESNFILIHKFEGHTEDSLKGLNSVGSNTETVIFDERRRTATQQPQL